ncbi:MAG: IS200/IS605 family transposase [Armatimonadota bacterium]
MSNHTYISCYIHYIFSTKNRQPFITSELQERLWPFLGGIARQNGLIALAIGGIADHIHVLLAIPATITIAKAVQLLKGGSSKWVHDTFPAYRDFAWQEGYGAFTLSHSGLENAVAYIKQQEKHHQRHTFKEEFIAFLERYHVEYDPLRIWD